MIPFIKSILKPLKYETKKAKKLNINKTIIIFLFLREEKSIKNEIHAKIPAKINNFSLKK